MHAHDRTLLSQLGFADPDKQSNWHKLACQYIALTENRLNIGQIFHDRRKGHEEAICNGFSIVRENMVSFELPIGKGEGKYKTTIGFVDLCFSVRHKYISDCKNIKCCRPGPQEQHSDISFYIEVKAIYCPVDELIRQINLYREYIGSGLWIAATCYPLSSADIEMLFQSRICHVYLGERFATWAASQEQNTETIDPSQNTEI